MTLPSDSPRPAAPAGRSLIAADVTITGDIGSDGTVEILGAVEGKISARTVIVGAEGRIKGSIAAESVDLRGNIAGKVTCATLTLRSTARVEADINYSAVTIENGAEVEGRFSRPKA
ncbi:MAG: polymer-forming cytoskeletal protein [Gemmobacter sp.]